MCCISFACNSWRRVARSLPQPRQALRLLRHACCVFVALLLASLAWSAGPADQARNQDIELAWAKLAQDLDQHRLDRLKEHCDQLESLAGNLGIRRLTPVANALTAHARTLPPADASQLLQHASRLDPDNAETRLSFGATILRNGRISEGLREVWRGLGCLFADQRHAHFVLPSLGLVLLLVAIAALGVSSLLAIRFNLRLLWHDLDELGGVLRLGPNSIALTLFALALPLFVGGDPAWAGLWLLALCWAYFSPLSKVFGFLLLLAITLGPVAVELATRRITHVPNPVLRVTSALAEQRYDPQSVEELAGLNESFVADPDYYRLLGDAFRLHGLVDTAAWAYREGLRQRPQDGLISLSLGVVHYLESDFNAALQAFTIAREQRARPVISSYNLALTLAQLYKFPESEAAIAQARAADPVLFRELTRGRSHQLMLPPFERSEAEALLARKDVTVRLNLGLLPPPLARERSWTHPFAIGGFLALLLAIGHYLVRRHQGLATACAKCGRAFCQRCKLSTESQTYCTQCVNIFLKKDMVSIESQMAKRSQLARRQVLLDLESRLMDLILPGSGLATSGRIGPALLLVPMALFGLAVGAIWLPVFIGPALMHTPTWPVAVPALMLWGAAVVTAQVLPRGRR